MLIGYSHHVVDPVFDLIRLLAHTDLMLPDMIRIVLGSPRHSPVHGILPEQRDYVFLLGRIQLCYSLAEFHGIRISVLPDDSELLELSDQIFLLHIFVDLHPEGSAGDQCSDDHE